MPYTIVLEPAENGGYLASVPDLPGVTAESDTLAEAARAVSDAIRDYQSAQGQLSLFE